KGMEANASDYECDLTDASSVLEDIRNALSFGEQPTNRRVRGSLWAWPTEKALVSRPKEWKSTSPADVDRLTDAIARYIERPWLQHNVIDGAAINGLLFSTLASTIELYNTGELFGRPNWSYVLSKGNI